MAEAAAFSSEAAQSAPTSFEVHLELFEGPLALLLHLIEKNNLNIMDIPISQITHEYLEYLEFMETCNMELTGEFLVMATALMQIKTKMLLPRVEEGSEDQDPRGELVSKLLLYQQFSKIARELQTKATQMELYAFRPAPVFEREEFVVVQNVFDLVGAFENLLNIYIATHGSSEAIAVDPYPVEAKIEKILNMLKTHVTLSLADVFKGEPNRQALVACFLAILELIKRGAVIALQKVSFGDIYLANNRHA